MQCGVAALCMICHHYGAKYSIQQLSDICHATKEGVSMLSIVDAAKIIGLDSIAGRFSCSDLSKIPLPCILNWNQNHFVVLYKIDRKDNYYIADPGKGLLVYSQTEVKKHWIAINNNDVEKGIAMLFKPTENFKKYSNNDNSQKKPYMFLLSYFNNSSLKK